jgi:hypothetical protein
MKRNDNAGLAVPDKVGCGDRLRFWTFFPEIREVSDSSDTSRR